MSLGLRRSFTLDATKKIPFISWLATTKAEFLRIEQQTLQTLPVIIRSKTDGNIT